MMILATDRAWKPASEIIKVIFIEVTASKPFHNLWLLLRYTGFAHLFRSKIQGLFKDFPGPYFEISRTSFSKNLPQNQAKCLRLNLCFGHTNSAKQNALFGFLSFRSHDLYPSFSSHFLLEWHLPGIVTSSTETPENECLNTCANQCTCGSTYMRESNERALGTKTSVFMHFVSISRMLYFATWTFVFTGFQ